MTACRRCPTAVSPAAIVLDHLADDAAGSRFEQIKEYYDARVEAREQEGLGAPPYNPVEPASLFLNEEEWHAALDGVRTIELTPFEQPDDKPERTTLSLGGRKGRTFAAERSQTGGNVFDAVKDHIGALAVSGQDVSWSQAGVKARATGSAPFFQITKSPISRASKPGPDITALSGGTSALAVLGLETGFETGRPRRYRRAGYSRRPPDPPHAQSPPGAGLPNRGFDPLQGRPRRSCRSWDRPVRRPPDDYRQRCAP